LVWTMLYPPGGEAWIQTYCWNGHLENFMTWNNSHTHHAIIKPPPNPYDMWNIWQGADLPVPLACLDNPHSSRLGISKHITPENLASKSNPNPLAQSSTPQSVILMSTISTLVAVMIFLVLDQQSSNSGLVTLPLIKLFAGSQYQNYQC